MWLKNRIVHWMCRRQMLLKTECPVAVFPSGSLGTCACVMMQPCTFLPLCHALA